jgi:TldD protein
MGVTSSSDYWETRQHELRKARIVMMDGRVTTNASTVEAGASARVRRGGYWGFASSPVQGLPALRDLAGRNAAAMACFGRRDELPLHEGNHRGEHEFRGAPALTPKDNFDRLERLHAYCKERFPAIGSVRLIAMEEGHRKQIVTSTGSDALSTISRALLVAVLSATDEQGAPIEMFDFVRARGGFADLDLSLERMAPVLESLHGHLQAKRHAIAVQGGHHRIVIAPALAGMLAHEAMGHPCEADLVLAGAVTGDLVGQRVASDLVSMVDYAHHDADGETLMPVYVDDEGVPAQDAVLIERGVLRHFMTSRETAAQLDMPNTGSARAYGPQDEPLVRMRNTAILRGTSKLDDMIADVEFGYLLMRSLNGQADSTTEFMFGVNLGYEIRNGKLGRAIRDTTVSGSAIKVLQAVDAVSDDMVWDSSGYCGKKQPMVVAMGGPALRSMAHLGGTS